MKGFNIPVGFDLQLDPKKVEAVEKKLAALFEQGGVDMNVDTEQAEAAIQQILEQLEGLTPLLDQLDIAVDATQAEKAIDEIAARLESLDAASLTITADGLDDIEAAAKAFDDLEASLERQKKALAVMSAQGKAGTEEWEKLSQVVQENTKRVDDMKAAFTGAGKAASDTAGGFEDTNKALNFLAVAEGAEQLKEVFSGIVERGSEYNDALKQIKAQTGLVGEELKALQTQAEDAFVRGVGESAAEALKNLGQARQLFGDSIKGDELTDLTVSLSNTAKAFDKEFGEVASRASTFQRSFNLDGKKTGDLVALALRDAKTVADDVLDTLGEYSPLIAQAGFSAEEFVGILTKAEGAFNTDKIADSIKELGIRLKAGDVTTGINDLVTNFGDRLPAALTDSLNAIAQEGQAGIKSVKDVLTESTQLIEAAFSSGSIDKNIRQGLQAAFAGTPAEEFGSDLYARAFGAPIDQNLVAAQAAAAQASIDDAFEPTFGEKIAKQFEAVEQRAAAAFVPLAKGGVAIADLAPKLKAIKDLVPAEAFEKLSGSLSNVMTKGLGGLDKAIGPLKDKLGSLGPALMGPWGIAIAAAIGLLALFFTQTEEGQAIFADIKETVTELYEQAKPALEAIGSVLGTIGKLIYEVLIANTEIAIDIISGLFEAVSGLFSSGDDADGQGMKDFFAAIVTGAEQAKIFIEGIIGAFKALKDNVGAALKALVTGDIKGFIGALDNIPEATAGAFKKGVEEAADKLETKKLQEKLSSALTIKANLDQNNALGDLVSKYKNATDAVTKQNLAAQIAQQVPAAVNSVKTVVDETTGKVTEVYDIALEKAQGYVEQQNQILTSGVDGGKDAFFELLVKQSDELETNKAKLQEMANAITEAAAAGKDTSKLTAEYEKQKEATEKSAEGLKNIVTQGKGLGVTAAEVEKLGTKAGKSAEDSKKLSASFALADQEVRKTAVSAKVLGDAFQQALSRVDGQLNTAVNALAGAQLRIRELTAQMRQEKDPGRLQQMKQELDDLRAKIPQYSQDLQKAAREQTGLTEIQANLQRRVDKIQESSLEKAQRELDLFRAKLGINERIFTLLQEQQLIDQKRERTALDDLALADFQLRSANAELDLVSEKYKVSKDQLDIIRQTIRESGEFDPTKIKAGIVNALRAAEKDGAPEIGQEVVDTLLNTLEKEQNKLKIRATIVADYSGLIDLQKQISDAQFNVDVELGIRGPIDILERTNTQLEILQARIASFEEEAAKVQQRLADPGIGDIERLRLQEKLVEYQTMIGQMKLEEIGLQSTVRTAVAETFDKRAALAQEAFDRESERIVAGYDRELAMVETFISKKLELESSAIEDAKEAELKAIDEVLAARQQALDEAQSVAEENLSLLEKFGLLESDGIDTERDLLERRLEMQKNFEAERKALEEQAQAEREAAEQRAAERALALQKIADGEALVVARKRELAELELRQQGLEEQKRIADEKARVSGLKADREAADAIGRELEGVAEQIEEKGAFLNEVTGTLQSGLSDTFATLFSGNEEAIADSFRGLFGVLGGALKKAASAFIVDIVLTSPWLKTAIGVNPLLGAAITAGVTGILTGIVNTLLDPVLASITSFASGGRVDTPTLAIVGDATKLGGSRDREWIMRDDQLWAIVAQATAAQTKALKESLDNIAALLTTQRVVGEMRGGDIYLVAKQVETQRAIRRRE